MNNDQGYNGLHAKVGTSQKKYDIRVFGVELASRIHDGKHDEHFIDGHFEYWL